MGFSPAHIRFTPQGLRQFGHLHPIFSLALGPVFAEETFGRGDGLPGRRERVVVQLAGQGDFEPEGRTS